jgi:predicted MFS family arabinose efflux permease
MSEAAEPQAPLGAAARAGLLGCGLFSTIGLFSPGLVLPQIERDFAANPHAGLLTQLIGAVASFAFAVGAPVAGALIARHGCRRVIVPALVLFALAGTAPLLLNDLGVIVATRIALGLALSGVFTGGLAGIGVLPEAERARMLGWFAVVGGAAAILLFPIVGAVARIDWHLAFGVHLVALAIVPLALRLPARFGMVAASASADGTGSMMTPAMWGLLGLAAFVGMSMFVAPMYSPLYLASIGISDTRVLAIPVTAGSIAAVLASALYGPLHGRLGIHGVFAAAMLCMGIALLAAGSVAAIPGFTAAIVVHSAMIALLAPNISAAALALGPAARGSQTIGLANGVMFGAQLLFPFVAAAVRGAAGLAAVFFVFGAVALLLGAAIGLRTLRSRGGSHAAPSAPPPKRS